MYGLRVIWGFIVALLTLAIMWGLSLLCQFISYITITGTHFDVFSRPASRLAAVSVIAIIIATALWSALIDGSWLLGILFIIGLSQIIPQYAWFKEHVFNETAVATDAAQIIYVIAVVLLGFIMYLIIDGYIEHTTAKAKQTA